MSGQYSTLDNLNLVNGQTPMISYDSLMGYGPKPVASTGTNLGPTVANLDAAKNLGIDLNNPNPNTNGMDWGMNGYGGLALGGGQLALGLLSYLDNRKMAGQQRKLMDQQMSNNDYVMSKRRANDAALAKAFGSYNPKL